MTAKEYLEHWKKARVWEHLLWPKHQRRFQVCASLLEGESFADVGCVFGHSTDHLNHFKAGKWAGLDFVDEAIIVARKTFPQYEFIFCSDYKMAEACGSRKFNSVVCSEVIEHVKEDALFCSELLRITGKKLILTTPNIPINDPGHLRTYSLKSLAALFPGQEIVITTDDIFFYAVVTP